MSNALAFGSFIPGESRIHIMNAQVKVILTCVFSIAVFFVNSWAGMLACCVLIACLYASAALPLSQFLGSLKPVVFLLCFTVLAQTICLDVPSFMDSVPNEAIAQAFWGYGGDGTLNTGAGGTLSAGSLCLPWGVVLCGAFGFTADGFARGLFFAIRIAVLIAACCLLSFTTSSVCIMDALAILLKPLRAVKVPVNDLCLVASIALRFIPTVMQEAQQVRCAQEARGALFQGGGALNALKSWGNVLSPLIVRLFRRADNLAMAMDARCYDGGKRSFAGNQILSSADRTVLVVGFLLVALIAVLL